MKNTLFTYLLLSCTLFIGCKPEPKADNATLPGINQPEEIEPYSNIIAEADKLKGLWLSDVFLTSVQKQKSIYKSQQAETTIFGFTIKSDSTSANKLLFNGFSDYEGGYDGIVAYHPEKKQFVHLSTGEEYEVLKQSFGLSIIENNKLQLEYENQKKENYRRISDIDAELRHILFEGTYTDTQSGNKVVFSKNGRVEGIEDKGFYVPLYTFDAGYEFDTVFLSLNEKLDNFDRYHFKIDGNTISLYSIFEDESQELSIGELMHTLVKK
ncbi:MAG: hypothetical protein V4581_01845 [Bacteroidota bacterium]